MWYIIILSAVLYSISFFIETLCWSIVLSPIPLWYVFMRMTNVLQACYAGLLWGIAVFGSINWWLFILLYTHGDVSLVTAAVAYAVIILYCASTVAFWFSCLWWWMIAASLRFRYVGVGLLSIGYFCFIEYAILFPLGKVQGYPFMMPYVPLAKSYLFLKLCALLAWLCNGIQPAGHAWQNYIELRYLAPVLNKQVGDIYKYNPCAVGQELYRQVCHNQTMYRKGKEIIFVGAESLYPFVINNHEAITSLWCSALEKHQLLMIGSYYEYRSKLYQTVFSWDQSRIMHFYVKKHCVPFVEKIHYPWRRLECLKELFLKGRRFFARGKHCIGEQIFTVAKGRVTIIPQICSELFMKTTRGYIQHQASCSKKNVIFFFVNDSWFVCYFKRLMRNSAHFKAIWWGVDIVYIGHEGISVFETL